MFGDEDSLDCYSCYIVWVQFYVCVTNVVFRECYSSGIEMVHLPHPKVVAIIQAKANSSRFTGKILISLGNATILESCKVLSCCG